MTVDVYRPPAPLGPRVPLWLKLVLLYVATVVFYVFIVATTTSGPDHGPNPTLSPTLGLILLSVDVAVSFLFLYLERRLVTDGSIMARAMSSRGVSVGEPSDTTRVSDPEERRARRLLRKGAITRREYEKAIARRHFVHGEITRSRYEEIIHELDEKNVDARKGARAPPGPQ